MADQELGKEERILRVMKRVLTDVAKDTYTKPGYRHPLSDNTVEGIRQCLVQFPTPRGFPERPDP